MNTTVPDVANQELTNTLARTEKLLAELKRAPSFEELKDSIMHYINDLDGASENSPSLGVLGDGDFAALFAQSLERRGKVPTEKWAPIILRACTAYVHKLNS